MGTMGRYRGKCGSAKLWVHSALRLPQATDTCRMTGLKSKLGHRPGKSGRDWEGDRVVFVRFLWATRNLLYRGRRATDWLWESRKEAFPFAIITGGNRQLSQLLHFPLLAFSQQPSLNSPCSPGWL